MANHNLKTTLNAAGLTVEQFAELIGVDPKTVQRWVAGRTPYPRHRATIARALDVTEHQLWPDEVPEPSADSGPATAGDVTCSWGSTDDPGAPDPVAFVADAQDRIDLYDGTYAIRQIGGLVDELLRRADDGLAVRLLTNAPTRVLERLLDHEHVELRLAGGNTCLHIRTGDAMLVTLNLSGEGDRPPPLLRLHRRVDGGMFDCLAVNFDDWWQNPEEIITDLAQLQAHLSNAEDELDDYDDADARESDGQPPRADPARPPSAQARAQPSAGHQPPRRQWPRRPQ